jgi:hypothetical protein
MTNSALMMKDEVFPYYTGDTRGRFGQGRIKLKIVSLA